MIQSVNKMGRPPKSYEKGFEKGSSFAKLEFGSWKYALKIAGLLAYQECSRKYFFSGKIRK